MALEERNAGNGQAKDASALFEAFNAASGGGWQKGAQEEEAFRNALEKPGNGPESVGSKAFARSFKEELVAIQDRDSKEMRDMLMFRRFAEVHEALGMINYDNPVEANRAVRAVAEELRVDLSASKLDLDVKKAAEERVVKALTDRGIIKRTGAGSYCVVDGKWQEYNRIVAGAKGRSVAAGTFAAAFKILSSVPNPGKTLEKIRSMFQSGSGKSQNIEAYLDGLKARTEKASELQEEISSIQKVMSDNKKAAEKLSEAEKLGEKAREAAEKSGIGEAAAKKAASAAEIAGAGYDRLTDIMGTVSAVFGALDEFDRTYIHQERKYSAGREAAAGIGYFGCQAIRSTLLGAKALISAANSELNQGTMGLRDAATWLTNKTKFGKIRMVRKIADAYIERSGETIGRRLGRSTLSPQMDAVNFEIREYLRRSDDCIGRGRKFAEEIMRLDIYKPEIILGWMRHVKMREDDRKYALAFMTAGAKPCIDGAAFEDPGLYGAESVLEACGRDKEKLEEAFSDRFREIIAQVNDERTRCGLPALQAEHNNEFFGNVKKHDKTKETIRYDKITQAELTSDPEKYKAVRKKCFSKEIDAVFIKGSRDTDSALFMRDDVIEKKDKNGKPLKENGRPVLSSIRCLGNFYVSSQRDEEGYVCDIMASQADPRYLTSGERMSVRMDDDKSIMDIRRMSCALGRAWTTDLETLQEFVEELDRRGFEMKEEDFALCCTDRQTGRSFLIREDEIFDPADPRAWDADFAGPGGKAPESAKEFAWDMRAEMLDRFLDGAKQYGISIGEMRAVAEAALKLPEEEFGDMSYKTAGFCLQCESIVSAYESIRGAKDSEMFDAKARNALEQEAARALSPKENRITKDGLERVKKELSERLGRFELEAVADIRFRNQEEPDRREDEGDARAEEHAKERDAESEER